jgi:hypothetical protein
VSGISQVPRRSVPCLCLAPGPRPNRPGILRLALRPKDFVFAEGAGLSGGDIDGRIKTLLDALAMPQHTELENNSTTQHPIYCLLEDDSFVSGLNIESERLLTDQNHPKDYVQLIIEVDVRVRQATVYNVAFLG